MSQFCEFCGSVLNNGQCMNVRCATKENKQERANGKSPLKKPISLRERRKQMYEAERGAAPVPTTAESLRDLSAIEKGGIHEYREYEVVTRDEVSETWEPVREQPSEPRSSRPAPTACESEMNHREITSRHFYEEEAQRKAPKQKATSEQDTLDERSLARFAFFVSDYCREPGKVVSAAARKRDVGVGIILIIASVCLSTIGTLIFGITYLEDFFYRWIVSGAAMPILAYGFSLLFGKLYVSLSSVKKMREQEINYRPVTFRELFAVVTVASVFPNLLLLLSCVISPMDKSLQTFQFFALLLTVAWILCLILSLFAVYGGGLSLGGLLLTVGFGFLAFVVMRAVWVWYLTGEFTFALYVPLSVFLTGH